MIRPIVAFSLILSILQVAVSAQNCNSSSQENILPRLANSEGISDYNSSMKILQKYIVQNIIYPEICKEMDIEGKVYIELTIGELNEIKNYKVIRSAHSFLDQEAVRVLKKFHENQSWLRGKGCINGVQTTLDKVIVPFNFSLE